MGGDLTDELRRRIDRQGPIGFEEFLDVALYDPDAGFYGAHGSAGRGGDFLTAPELGPLFGAVLARALDTWWADLGRPDPFVVVEAGAGEGTLCRDVLAAAPACAPALRYVLVERSARLRDRASTHLPVELPAFVLGAVREDEEDEPTALPGQGPLVTTLEDLPAEPVTGVVFANELLDNLPFALLERRGGRWHEVRVGEADGSHEAAAFEEVLLPAPPGVAADADRLAPEAPEGARIPRQRAATAWLRRALRAVERGRVVLVDYAATTSELATRPQGEWLRTYRGGGPGGPPLDAPGTQDVTVDVCLDQLAHVLPVTANRSQADFLRAHGLDELVAEARAAWEAAAARPDLAALRARSRLGEADALTDPAGMGAFRVLEWTRP